MTIDLIKDTIIFSNLVQICGYDPKQDSCKGDSGGPMTLERIGGDYYFPYYKHYLIGVVSYGNKHCGNKK